jgi:hypothetical protein
MLTLRRVVEYLAVLITFASCHLDAVYDQTSIGPAPAANAWMKVASPVSAALNLEPILRFDRDSIFDSAIGSPAPLTPANAGSSHMSQVSYYGDLPEIPALTDSSLVIVGRFVGFQSILSSSHRSVYTEIDVAVQQVIGGLMQRSLGPGNHLTILIPGGTVDLGGGAIVSYLTDGQDYSLQPNHSYLLILKHQPKGDFFTVEREWDITGGVARPNSPYEAERLAKGKSRVSGLLVPDAIAEVRKAIPAGGSK